MLNTHPEAKGRERALLIAAEFGDEVRVREQGGANRGYWVEKFLGFLGLGPGFAWCAAFVSYCLHLAETKAPKFAAVRKWVAWAEKEGRIVTVPERGDLFFWLDGAYGHIGFVAEWQGDLFRSIEGNTGPSGGRDGDGVYRKLRRKSRLDLGHKRAGFISLKGL